MKQNKEIIRKTIAFVTAVSFISATQFQNAFITINAVSDLPSASVTNTPEKSSSGTGSSTSVSTTPPQSQTSTSTTTTTPSTKQLSFDINISGVNSTIYSVKDKENIINQLFDFSPVSVSDNKITATVLYSDSDDISDYYKKDIKEKLSKKESVFVCYNKSGSNIYFKLTNTAKSEISLDEYYTFPNTMPDSLDLTYVFTNSEISNNQKLIKYGTTVTVSPKPQWKFMFDDQKNLSFDVKGNITTKSWTLQDMPFGQNINNGSDEYSYSMQKKTYSVTFKKNDDKEYYLNGTKISKDNTTDCTWADNKTFSAHVSAPDKYKIDKIIITDSSSDTVFSYDPEEKTKDYSLNIDLSTFKEPYKDNEQYNVQVSLVPEHIKASIFCIDKSGIQSPLDDSNISIDSHNRLEIPTIIYKDNNKQYIAYGYKTSNIKDIVPFSSMIDISSNHGEKINIHEKIQQSLPILIQYCYEHNIDIYYKEISKNTEYDVTVNQTKCVKTPLNTNSYTIPSAISLKLLSFLKNVSDITTDTDNSEFDVIYDVLFEDGTKKTRSYNSTDQNFIYTALLNQPTASAIAVKSIINIDKNNNAYNILNEPVYFYMDNNKPVVEFSNQENNQFNNDLWADGIYDFTINVNDRETFSKETAGDEISAALNNVYSKTKQIQIGDYIFVKSGDDTWVNSEGSGSSAYNVILTETSEGIYNASVTSPLSEGFKETLKVIVTDDAQNIGENSIEVKIDNSAPDINNIQLDNLKDGSVSVVSNNNSLKVHITATDKFSGVKSVNIQYGDTNNSYYDKTKYASDFKTTGENKIECEFEIQDKNAKGIIAVTVTDNVGHTDVMYYKGKTPVIIDNASPECTISIKDEDPYNKNNDNKMENWYSKYPDVNITADDPNPEICSTIETMKIKVNGIENIITGINLASIDDYVISFVPDKDDPLIFTAVLKYKNAKLEPLSKDLGTFRLTDTNGKIEIGTSVSDYAGNTSSNYQMYFFVDVTAPEAAPVFQIITPDVQYRKFGTFFNSGIILKADISYKAPSSGLSHAILTFSGDTQQYTVNNTGTERSQAEFKLPVTVAQKLALKGEAIIEVFDHTGHSSGKTELKSHMDNSLIILEDTVPVISQPVITGDNKYTDKENRTWYSSDVEVKYNYSDDDTDGTINSGLSKASITVNNKPADSSDYTENIQKQTNDSFILNTSSNDQKDGEFKFDIFTEDNATNKNQASVTIYKDVTAPDITGFRFESFNDKPETLHDRVTLIPFGYFFDKDTNVTVYANDLNASSEIETIDFTLYNFDGSIFKEFSASGSSIIYENGEYHTDFTVPEGFKGNITASATDHVKNRSDEKAPKGFILENASRHSETSSVGISMPETSYHDINGVPLYSGDINAKLTANDTFSGIQRVEWTVSDYGENIWRSINIDSNGVISGDDASEWQITGSERNIITGISRNLNSSSNLNNNTIKLRITDNSGNVSETETHFSIDKTAPEIEVTFDNNSPDNKYTDTFKDSRTAVIRIRERNFESSRANINITNSSSSSSPSVGSWSLVAGTEGTDSAVYQTSVTFFNDGTYQFTVNCTDTCENAAAQYSSQSFIIDKTAPAASVQFDNNDVINSDYYSKTRTAVITITENNFDPERIHISGTRNGNASEFPAATAWSSHGNSHSTTIIFKDDGNYTLQVTGSDKAGNSLNAPYSTSFNIDTHSPEISFSGVADKSANNGDVIPSILFKDTNLDTSTAVISMSGAKRGADLELKGEFSKTDTGYVFNAENFPKEKGIDDIYTIKASIKDMSGNTSSKTITFSVNRFGSNYVFDEETKKIANTYMQQECDIIIHEVNVDKLKGNPTIKIIKDSKNNTLSEGKDYTVTYTGGNGSWYEYEYVISKDNFSDDAAYTVTIFSEDEAGNKNQNIDESKKAELSFGVDKTSPTCTAIDLEKNGTYKTDSKTVHVSISDNILIQSVNVYLNGSPISSDFDGNDCTFEIKSSKVSQSVNIITTDMAGNTNELTIDNVFVSTNTARILLHKTWFRIAGAAVLIAAAAGGVFIIIKKKRERDY